MSELPEGTILSLSKYRILTLYNDKGNVIGELDFHQSGVMFEGNVDESANSLFKLLQNAIGPFLEKE